MSQFGNSGNWLEIGGRSLESVLNEVGQTPFYAYDRQVMTRQVEQLRAAFPPELHLHYAMKANPMPEVVRHFAGITDGLDVASAGELEIALDTGIDPRMISFAGPGKSAQDLSAAVKSRVIINVESEGELQRIAHLAVALETRPRVAIRVNPDFELKTSGMKMGGGPKPFGVDAERVPAMLQSLADMPVEFMGFHIYSGSQNLRTEAIIEAQTKTFELAYRLAEHAPSAVQWLNIGGGLGVPYFPGEKRLELGEVADNLAALVAVARERLPEAELVMELGRYLVAASGIYVCEVIDRKVSRGETFLVTNGGLHHHLAASGNFGQVIRKNYPVAIGNRMAETTTEIASVVGPLCTPLDILADKAELPVASEGDLVVVYQSGAYGFTASPHHFLGHPPPAQICL
jgi:diaminopimelate decarboxylase